MRKPVLWLATLAELTLLGWVVEPCSSPPYMWCETDEIMAACRTRELCTRHREERRNKRLLVTLLYQSLCPECLKFLRDQLKPDLFEIATRFVDFEFVPFGNAELIAEGGSLPHVVCPNGPKVSFYLGT